MGTVMVTFPPGGTLLGRSYASFLCISVPLEYLKSMLSSFQSSSPVLLSVQDISTPVPGATCGLNGTRAVNLHCEPASEGLKGSVDVGIIKMTVGVAVGVSVTVAVGNGGKVAV